ncbi:hypothetical protein BH24ACT1_BH24ACT1_02990 [soil metagenome]
MRLALLALLAGLAVAVALGGRLANVPGERLRWPSLTFVAVLLYWAPALLGATSSAAAVLILFSYAALLAFALANLRLTGMAVVGLGLALNASVILANGGMPVDPSAVVATGLVRPDELLVIELGPGRQWLGPDDHLAVLGDIVPVAVLDEVVSFGDLVLAAGLANVAFRLLRPAAGRRSSGSFRRHGRRLWSSAGFSTGPWAPAG